MIGIGVVCCMAETYEDVFTVTCNYHKNVGDEKYNCDLAKRGIGTESPNVKVDELAFKESVVEDGTSDGSPLLVGDIDTQSIAGSDVEIGVNFGEDSVCEVTERPDHSGTIKTLECGEDSY